MIDFNRQAEIMRLCQRMLWWRAPKATYNLANNAIKCDYQGGGVWTLTIDESIAPYMPYTNEPWLSEKWRNKKTGEMRRNPNEAWFEHAVADVAELIRLELGGQVTKD